ncbi:quinolinate synthase NadA, partial [Muricomes intestini]
HRQFCPNMKRIKLESVLEALERMGPEVQLDEEIRQKAKLPLERMLQLAAEE